MTVASFAAEGLSGARGISSRPSKTSVVPGRCLRSYPEDVQSPLSGSISAEGPVGLLGAKGVVSRGGREMQAVLHGISEDVWMWHGGSSCLFVTGL